MKLMAALVAAGGLYFAIVIAALVGFCWYVVRTLRAIAVERELARKKLEDFMSPQRETLERSE